MAERRNAAPNLIDGLTAELGGPRTCELLRRLEAVVPWEKLARRVRKLYKHDGPGRPAWPAVMMLKCLMLQKWYGLSDPALEEALQDRLSFRRFVGLSLTDKTPDSTTFVRFRKRLREQNMDDALFTMVESHLDETGYLIREGTMVDATIIEASRGTKRPDGSSTSDPDADFTKKAGQTRHGYKAHVAVDVRSKLIMKCVLSSAREHEIRFAEALADGKSPYLLADSAYSSEKFRSYLESLGVVPLIARRGTKGHPINHWQRYVWNPMVARFRYGVEHVFGAMKGLQDFRRVRYRGLRRNAFDLRMNAIAYNFRRLLSLEPA